MASILFNAIGRGYSARSILSSLANKAPKYASYINNGYYYGYTANQILSTIASKKDKMNYDPDMFLTEFEKTQKTDQDQKRNRLIGALAAAGTLGAAGAGLYALIQRNKPIKPEIIFPEGVKKGKKGQKEPYTIYQGRPQIGNEQKQIQHVQPATPQAPQRPPMLPFYPPQQQAQGQSPQPQGQPPQPQGPSPQQPKPTFNMKNVDLVNNLKESSRFNNILSAGFDPDSTELALRATVPKDVLSILDKTQGGLAQVIKDYNGYMKENPAISPMRQKIESEKAEKEKFANQPSAITPAQAPIEAAEQVGQAQLPTNKNIQQAAQAQTQAQQPQQQMPQAQTPKPPMQPIAPVEQPQVQKPQAPTKPLVSLKNGKVGEVESIQNGVANINVDGKTHKEKATNLTDEPPEMESAVREIINSIPENMKSTALQSMVHIPGMNVLLTQFYDGKWAWYKDIPEDLYKSIALGTYQPKGQSKTGIAEYNPGVADSRGAGFHNEIKINPKYSKENKGDTWGYADNAYALLHSVQNIIHKISKERYDTEGNLIQPKSKKTTRESPKKEVAPKKETIVPPKKAEEPIKPTVSKPVSQPAKPPVIHLPEVKKPKVSETGINEAFQQMGSGITQGLYDGIFNSLKEGKSTFAGIKDPLIQRAKPFYEAGLIKSPKDLKEFANNPEKFVKPEKPRVIHLPEVKKPSVIHLPEVKKTVSQPEKPKVSEPVKSPVIHLPEVKKPDTLQKIETKIHQAAERPDVTAAGLKRQKDYILDKVNKELVNLEGIGVAAGKLEINVPGDGTFRIEKDEKRLNNFKEKIKNEWPEEPEKSAKQVTLVKPRQPKSLKSPEEYNKLMKASEKEISTLASKLKILKDNGKDTSMVEKKYQDEKDHLENLSVLHKESMTPHEKPRKETNKEKIEKTENTEKKVEKGMTRKEVEDMVGEREKIENRIFKKEEQDKSEIFGKDAKEIKYEDPVSRGYIKVIKREEGASSVIDLYVPEEFRGKGIGKALQSKAMKEHPNLMGQISSKYAAKSAYDLGRRPPGMPNATLKEVYDLIDENSSVNMVINPNKGELKKETDKTNKVYEKPESLKKAELTLKEQEEDYEKAIEHLKKLKESKDHWYNDRPIEYGLEQAQDMVDLNERYVNEAKKRVQRNKEEWESDIDRHEFYIEKNKQWAKEAFEKEQKKLNKLKKGKEKTENGDKKVKEADKEVKEKENSDKLRLEQIETEIYKLQRQLNHLNDTQTSHSPGFYKSVSVFERAILELEGEKLRILRRYEKELPEKKSELSPNENESVEEWENRIKKKHPHITQKALSLMKIKYKFK